jgi:septal ring factor EnvC (AmiA/AmiB activator)
VDREKHVLEIEYLLHEAYATLQQYTEEELLLKWKHFTEQATVESQKLEEVLKDKNVENKRLKDAFCTLQRQNSALKKQLLDIQNKNGSLESQISHIQGRLTNLQVRMI